MVAVSVVLIGGGNSLMSLGKRIKSFVYKVRRKIFRPKVLRRIVSETNASPRLRNVLPEDRDAKPVVYRIKSSSELADTFSDLEVMLKRFYLKLIEGKRVLIKYNLNTANPYPASVDPQMLKGVVEIMHRLGAEAVFAGDCCTVSLIPTRNQVKKAGLPAAIKKRAKLICFDELPWVTVLLACEHLKFITIPLPAVEAETIISIANLKTHKQAVFTGALKLAVGFMHPLERYDLHRSHLQEKIAEINLALQSDLYIMDARKAMITGGPDFGKTVNAETVLLSNNPLAVDIEAFKLLYSLKERHGCVYGFPAEPFDLIQLSHARDIGVGGMPWQGYVLEDYSRL